MDGSLPSGAEWHRDLLMQMADEVTAVRPAVITAQTRHCLDEYRGFRHIVRNVYSFNLRPSQLSELTTELPACYAATKEAISDFLEFLEEAAQNV